MLEFLRRPFARNPDKSTAAVDHSISARNEPKVFCIGLNKTGTTSLELALQELGYRMGNQPTAELLIEPWARRDFGPIIEFVPLEVGGKGELAVGHWGPLVIVTGCRHDHMSTVGRRCEPSPAPG